MKWKTRETLRIVLVVLAMIVGVALILAAIIEVG